MDNIQSAQSEGGRSIMMFYNGFNLMIDMIIIGLALIACRRYWLNGYSAGQYDLRQQYEAQEQYFVDSWKE